MAERLLMLALSPTMQEGVIVKWRKKTGDPIAPGDVLCDVETDKAVMEYETIAEGTLLKILVAEGQKAAIGDAIAIIGQAGEDVSATPTEPKTAAKTDEAVLQTPTEAKPATKKDEPTDKVRSSPLARKLAEKHGVDWQKLKGSGTDGRVVERDVEAAIGSTEKGPALTGDDEVIPVSGKRKIIAQRLTESKRDMPHYYLKLTAAADGLLAARHKLNLDRDKKVSFNAFLIKFAAETLKLHPIINASWQTDTIVKHGRIDIALAVAQTDGLITPVVRDCANKGILQIDQELAELVELAQKNSLQPDQYSDSTFTITNLGSFGIEEFTAIINPPNAAILAVGKVQKTPAVDQAGGLTVRVAMKLTLCCDHRIVDGAVGAAFLTELAGMIEHPLDGLI